MLDLAGNTHRNEEFWPYCNTCLSNLSLVLNKSCINSST